MKLYNSDVGDQQIATCSRLMKGNVWYYKFAFTCQKCTIQKLCTRQVTSKTSPLVTSNSCQYKYHWRNFFFWDTLSRSVPQPLADTCFTILLKLPLIPTTRCPFTKQKQHINVVFATCRCVQYQLPSSKTKHCRNIFFIQKGMLLWCKRLKDELGRPMAGHLRPRQRGSR